jgi:hypothetical protein
MVLRRIFGMKTGNVTGGWRTSHNEELHNLHSPPNIIRVIKSRTMGWTVLAAHMGEMRNTYKCSVRKPEGKRPFGKPGHRLDNIKMQPTRGPGCLLPSDLAPVLQHGSVFSYDFLAKILGVETPLFLRNTQLYFPLSSLLLHTTHKKGISIISSPQYLTW